MRRNSGIDLLRGLAAFGIVGCHLSLSPETVGAAWLRHFCDFNVAVFAVLAGLMMGSVDTCKNIREKSTYIAKRARRILPVYAVWTIVFLAASVCFQASGSCVSSRFTQPLFWVQVVFRGNASCHLYFLISLFYSQIIIALFSNYMKRWTLLILGAICVFIASTGYSWCQWYFLRIVGFVCVGKALSGEWCRANKALFSLRIFLTGAALALHCLLYGVLQKFLCDLIAVIPVCMLFASLDKIIARHPRMASVCAYLSATSMAVFLVHPIFTKVGSVMVVRFYQAPYSAVAIALDWGICWVVAFLVASVLIRIPYVKRVCS